MSDSGLNLSLDLVISMSDIRHRGWAMALRSDVRHYSNAFAASVEWRLLEADMYNVRLP